MAVKTIHIMIIAVLSGQLILILANGSVMGIQKHSGRQIFYFVRIGRDSMDGEKRGGLLAKE